MTTRFAGGIDVGSCTTKAVVVDGDENILGSEVLFSATDFEGAATTAWTKALLKAGLSVNTPIPVVSTGYGRNSVKFACRSLTEISCHARGCLRYFNGPVTIVDIGGQDNKIIKIDGNGIRKSFKMNRKCAAGTGAFLEEMALRLRLPIEQLNDLAQKAEGEVVLGSYCTVFSGTEVLEKIKSGHPVDRIVRGLFHSVVKRILEMDTLTDTVVMTGGVIEHNPFLIDLLKTHITNEVVTPPHPQIMGALGAALYAVEEAHKNSA
ncbi:MAG: acyl-CoA dehydratase activase [Pseudomonadota bacterium]